MAKYVEINEKAVLRQISKSADIFGKNFFASCRINKKMAIMEIAEKICVA